MPCSGVCYISKIMNPSQQKTEVRESGLEVPRKEKTGQAGKAKAGKSISESLNPNL